MHPPSRRWIASLATIVLLLPGCDGSDDAAADTTRAATTAAPTTTTGESTTATAGETTTTAATPSTMPSIQDDTAAALAPIGATWSYLGTVDDWLTEPAMQDGRYYATSKGLDVDTQ